MTVMTLPPAQILLGPTHVTAQKVTVTTQEMVLYAKTSMNAMMALIPVRLLDLLAPIQMDLTIAFVTKVMQEMDIVLAVVAVAVKTSMTVPTLLVKTAPRASTASLPTRVTVQQAGLETTVKPISTSVPAIRVKTAPRATMNSPIILAIALPAGMATTVKLSTSAMSSKFGLLSQQQLVLPVLEVAPLLVQLAASVVPMATSFLLTAVPLCVMHMASGQTFLHAKR